LCGCFFVNTNLKEEIMNVILNVTTAPVALPAGVTAGLLALSVTDPSGNTVNDTNGQAIAAQQVSGSTATFANVGAGDYLANASRLDTAGNPIGAVITQAFTVTAPVIAPSTTNVNTGAIATSAPVATTFEAPQTITVTLS
jgi:hypothetical protein